MRRDEQHVVPRATPRGRPMGVRPVGLPPHRASVLTESPALRAAAFLGCFYRAYATEGVDKQIVDSALVFDGGAVASGLAGNDDAVQCLRAAIAEVLTTGTGSVAAEGIPWVSNVVATAYTDSAGEQDSKVTFSISMKGIDAQTVLDDLTNAAVDTTNLMAQLNLVVGPSTPSTRRRRITCSRRKRSSAPPSRPWAPWSPRRLFSTALRALSTPIRWPCCGSKTSWRRS